MKLRIAECLVHRTHDAGERFFIVIVSGDAPSDLRPPRLNISLHSFVCVIGVNEHEVEPFIRITFSRFGGIHSHEKRPVRPRIGSSQNVLVAVFEIILRVGPSAGLLFLFRLRLPGIDTDHRQIGTA